MTAVGFEPTPFRTGAFSQRLRPLRQIVLLVVGVFARLRSRPRSLSLGVAFSFSIYRLLFSLSLSLSQGCGPMVERSTLWTLNPAIAAQIHVGP